MTAAACLWSLPGPLPDRLRVLADLGCLWVDVEPDVLGLRDPDALLADAGLRTRCIAADHHLPAGLGLASGDAATLDATLRHLDGVMAAFAETGGSHAYLTPPAPEPGAEAAFGDALLGLADSAARAGLALCIEHAPTRAFATAAQALAFVRDADHPALRLLLDTGHCLLTREDFLALCTDAADHLGYVHVNGNDGAADLHWPPGRGLLTAEHVAALAARLDDVGFAGGVALELHPALASLHDDLRRSLALLDTGHA